MSQILFAFYDTLLVLFGVVLINLLRSLLYLRITGNDIMHSARTYLGNAVTGFAAGIPLGFGLIIVSNSLGGSDILARSIFLTIVLTLSLVTSHYGKLQNPVMLTVATSFSIGLIYVIHWMYRRALISDTYIFLWTDLVF